MAGSPQKRELGTNGANHSVPGRRRAVNGEPSEWTRYSGLPRKGAEKLPIVERWGPGPAARQAARTVRQ